MNIVNTSGSVAAMIEFVGTAEVAAMLGVSKQRVSALTSRTDFPEPIATLAMGKVWRTEDVLAWARERGREVGSAH